MNRTVVFVAVAAVAMFASACGSSPETKVRADSPQQQQPQPATPDQAYGHNPRCKGELLAINHADLTTDLPRGPQTPQDALTNKLRIEYPNLTIQSFTETADSSTAADPSTRAAVFTYDDANAGELMA